MDLGFAPSPALGGGLRDSQEQLLVFELVFALVRVLVLDW